MKDLKHLIYFENLLQEANNELVKQAKKDGKKILGYTCYVILAIPCLKFFSISPDVSAFV